MTARSPSAYLTSATLHLLLAALLFLGAYMTRQQAEETPTVFELVAGLGDNYAATQAPALGNTTSPVNIKVDIPEPPAPTPTVTPAEPEPSPITPAPSEPAPVIQPVPESKGTTAPATPKLPNYAKDVARLADKRANNIEKKFRADRAKKAAEAAKKAAERMTKEEFDRLNGRKSASSTTKASKSGPIRTAKIDVEGITGGVVGGSTANKTGGAGGTALEVQNRDLTQAYIGMIIQRIRESVAEAGITDLLTVRVQFRVSQWGTVSDATILTTSGSGDFDRAVLEAFRTIGKMPPPPSKQAESFAVNLTLTEL